MLGRSEQSTAAGAGAVAWRVPACLECKGCWLQTKLAGKRSIASYEPNAIRFMSQHCARLPPTLYVGLDE